LISERRRNELIEAAARRRTVRSLGLITEEEKDFLRAAKELSFSRGLICQRPKAPGLIVRFADDPGGYGDNDAEKEALKIIVGGIEHFFAGQGLFFEPEEVMIQNHRRAKYARVCRNTSPVTFSLAIDDLGRWGVSMFQLGYLMMSLYMNRLVPDPRKRISWTEQMIFYTASLYTLHWFEKHWSEIPVLYPWDIEYDEAIRNYLLTCLKDEGNQRLSHLQGYDGLVKFDQKYEDKDCEHEMFTVSTT